MSFTDYKMILWGHKMHSHTHSYIHNGFFRAFKHMGFNAFWFDENDNVSNFDFSKSLFITEGQTDKNIPLREDCLYLLHNAYDAKYQPLKKINRCMQLQVYTDDIIGYKIPQIEKCIHYDIEGKCLYFPWATDLLPYEIDANKSQISFNKNSNVINWVGSIGAGTFGNIDQITPFSNACQNNGKTFTHAVSQKSVEDNMRLIQHSYMAPTIVGKWQQEKGYVPCRIFKNISYGQFGITNSPRVYDLFDQKIVYNSDSHQLFYDARSKLENLTTTELHTLMDLVKNKHTYINRIEHIFTSMSQALGV